MKHLLTILLLTLTLFKIQAQTLQEWTRQKETQKKYLLEQIAALKVYNDYMQKGFTIAREGLTLMGNIKRGDFRLHENYFTSLKIVNPVIKKDWQVAAIIALQLQTAKAFMDMYQQLKQCRLLKSEEVSYYYTTGTNLIEKCIDNLNELIQVISEDSFQMKDEERLKRLDLLYQDMAEKNAFLQSFNNQFKLLALQRQQEQKDIRTGQTLYDLK